jgi:hypothetical protein
VEIIYTPLTRLAHTTCNRMDCEVYFCTVLFKLVAKLFYSVLSLGNSGFHTEGEVSPLLQYLSLRENAQACLDTFSPFGPSAGTPRNAPNFRQLLSEICIYYEQLS